jgi:hypothetical protein
MTKRGKINDCCLHNYRFSFYLVYPMIPQVKEMGWYVVLRGIAILGRFCTQEASQLTELQVHNRYPYLEVDIHDSEKLPPSRRHDHIPYLPTGRNFAECTHVMPLSHSVDRDPCKWDMHAFSQGMSCLVSPTP